MALLDAMRGLWEFKTLKRRDLPCARGNFVSQFRHFLTIAAVLFCLPAMSFGAGPPPEDGFVLTQWGDWTQDEAVRAVDDAQRAGARHISILLTLCQSSKRASDPHWCDAEGQAFETTELAQKLLHLIPEILVRRMTFSLLPIITTPDEPVRQWVNPDDHAAWFRTYGDRMVELARFSQLYGAGSFIVGSELTLLFLDDSGWRDVIRRVRPVYSGHLTISSVFLEYPAIQFWDALDSIGISAYFPLTLSNAHLSQQWVLDAAWDTIKAALEAFAVVHAKPLMFVEVGYPNMDVAASAPWSYDWPNHKQDEELPRRCWEAFRNAWSKSAMLRAFQIWGLSGQQFELDNTKGYSPLHKASETVVERLFSERAGI